MKILVSHPDSEGLGWVGLLSVGIMGTGVTQAVGIVSAMDLWGRKLYKLKISNPIVQNIKGIMMP